MKIISIKVWCVAFFTYFLLASNLAANEKITLHGKVISETDGEVIPYALITVKTLSDIRTRADDEGNFLLNLPEPGKYEIKASIQADLKGESAWVSIQTEQYGDNRVLELNLTLLGTAIEFVVTEDYPNRQLSELTISKKDINRAAGTSGDVFWIVQTLPGVAISDDGSEAPAVRGSFPGDNIFYVDFLPVGFLYHDEDSVSVIDSNFIREINFYPSAYGPEYGDKLGGTFDINLIEPDSEQWRHSFGFSLLGFTLGTQGPITENQSAFFGFRRSFMDVVIKLTDLERLNDNEVIVAPRYDDYQGKYRWKLNSNNILNFHINGARDRSIFDENPDGNPWVVEADRFYHTQAIVWDSFLGQHSSKMAVGYLTKNLFDVEGVQSETREAIKNIFLREKIHYQLNEDHAITIGGDLSTQKLSYYNDWRSVCDGEICRLITDVDNRINYGAAYLKDRWKVTDQLSLDIGARLNGNDLVKRFYLGPRLGLSWHMIPKTTLTAAWGRHNQMGSVGAEFGTWGRANLKHHESDHYVLGVSHQFKKDWHWKTELFYKKMWNLLEWDFNKGVNVNNGSGKAYGAELFIKKEFSRQLSGWFSLTYSRAKLTNNRANFTAPTDFDQPIIATLLISKQFSSNWYFDLKWNFHSGRPYMPITDGIPITNDETGEIDHYRPVFGNYNSARYPNYHKLDMRVSKVLKYSGWDLRLFLALLNAYNQRNVKYYDYSFDKKTKIPRYQMPLFPSIGFKANF